MSLGMKNGKKLYYQQGRYLPAEQLFRTVLAVKPWHVGALSGIVVSYAERHAVHEARTGAALRLPKIAPPTSSNRRRQQWVSWAVQQAEAILQLAEKSLQNSFFGQADHHVSTLRHDEMDNTFTGGKNINPTPLWINNFPHFVMEEKLKHDQDAWL